MRPMGKGFHKKIDSARHAFENELNRAFNHLDLVRVSTILYVHRPPEIVNERECDGENDQGRDASNQCRGTLLMDSPLWRIPNARNKRTGARM